MADKHLLIIDDDHELTDLLAEYLTGEGYFVSCCHDGESGLTQATSQQIDLILLDVMMPKLNGFEVLKALGDQYQVPVLMLTAKGDNADKILGLELGADDYLAKPFQMRELLARIHAILRRVDIIQQQQTSISQQPQQTVNSVRLDHQQRQAYCHQQAVELTGTEYQMLHYLVEHHGQIVSKQDLSERVLGRKLTAFDRSIDMHVSNIRRKLAQYSPTDKFKTVRGAGYIFLSGEN